MKLKLSILTFLAASAAMAQTAHSASLTWIQSTTPGITSNSIYRASGACPATGTPTFVSLSTSATPETAYTDNSVAAGTTYCYAVTASAGSEASGYSAFATAAIPSTTNAPTNLTVTTAELIFPALGIGDELLKMVTVTIPS